MIFIQKGVFHIKIIICANQVFSHRHKHLKKKVRNCNAKVTFNQECLRQKLIPILQWKIFEYFQHFNKTYRKIQFLRIKDEIKCLYTKKSIQSQTVLVVIKNIDRYYEWRYCCSNWSLYIYIRCRNYCYISWYYLECYITRTYFRNKRGLT
jgi:hypothetical protein